MHTEPDKEHARWMGDWYEKYIEEDIRDMVHVLRDEGFNTECSCGHEMYVQCQYIPEGEIHRLHMLLCCYLHEKGLPVNFEITVSHLVVDGKQYSTMDVRFPKKDQVWGADGHYGGLRKCQ